MVHEAPVLPGSAEEVEGVLEKRIRKDCEGAKTGSTVLGRCKNPVRRVFCVILMATCLQKPVHSAERLVLEQRVAVEHDRGRAVTALHPRPQILTVAIAVRRACERPSRRRMSCVILVVIASQQASRGLRWRVAIGGYHADAMGQSMGVMG